MLSVVIGMEFSWFVKRSVTRPVQQAVELARAISDGTLAAAIHVQSNDELAKLGGSVGHA